MMTTPTTPWNAPRVVPSPWSRSDYHWWYLAADKARAGVFRTARTDPEPVLLATIRKAPPPTEGPTPAWSDRPLQAINPHDVELFEFAGPGGVNYLATLVVMTDVAERFGHRQGEEAAWLWFNPATGATATLESYRECVALADDADAWAEKFGVRTSPAKDERLVDRMLTTVGAQDDDLARLGVPDESHDALYALLVMLWETAYLAAYEAGAKRIAGEVLRERDNDTHILVAFTERTELTVSVAELRKVIAHKLAADPAMVDRLAEVHAADPVQLARIAADSGAELRAWLLDKRNHPGSGAVAVESATVVTEEAGAE